MSAFFKLSGATALSEFRLERLRSQVKAIAPALSELSATFFYLVWSDGELDQGARERLMALLAAQPEDAARQADGAIYVLPRLGTISPWASKATDIAHSCGFDSIHRIERGIRYRLTIASGDTLDQQGSTRVAALLHDRMTESALLADSQASPA